MRVVNRLCHGIEHRNPLDMYAAAPRRDSRHDLAPVIPTLLGMEQAAPTGDPLDKNLGIFIDQYGHDFLV